MNLHHSTKENKMAAKKKAAKKKKATKKKKNKSSFCHFSVFLERRPTLRVGVK